MSIQVSVVVPTYKRPDLLRKCLHALVRQHFPPEAYEIVIVDDACSEETRSLVEQYSKPNETREPGAEICPRVRYAVAPQTQGPAAARNIGWRMAAGEVIAFTDDDCLPEPGWLREGVAAFQDGIVAVTGQVIVPIPDQPTDYEKNISRLAESEFVTANCFCHRLALEACGGFEERFTAAWREDSDLHFHILREFGKLGHAPAARVVHPVRSAPWGISIKEQRKSMFDALLYKKYPDLYRQRISARPPINYYGIVLSTVGFIMAILIGNMLLALICVGIWSALILHFTARRLQHTKHTPGHILEMLVTSMVIPYLSIFWRLYGAVYYRVFFF